MTLFYPDDLPVVSRKNEIISAIKKYPVVIVAGDTGSGKTTQLPKMCMEALGENSLLIGCTQPRRIAAASVAARVAEELRESSALVGYKIRFHDKTSKTTKIKFMTDGILLAATRQDRDLSRYSVIIIDEAHERSLNIDFLLGYLKRLLERRAYLKILITSATIDTEAFARHFNNAPVITVTGRTYPVLVRYSPPPEESEEENEVDHCVQAVLDIISKEPRGDILVFLPTEQDIRECCQELEHRLDDYIILPLYSRLAGGDQQRIFQAQRKPKIVVATNIAETSITVPGIRYVVDSGLARISQYNARARTTSLPVTRIAKASCEQRKGRCGRVGPGVCIRLYSEEDFLDRPEHTLPELKRSNLAEVILQMIDLQLGSPETFPFLDPPFKNSIREGFRTLVELGAITTNGQLTSIGKIMADLPIDPSISRVIIAARDYNCLKEIKILSAVLAIQDPRIRPAGQEDKADNAHAAFAHPQSDFMALLNIWDQIGRAHV
jgi:ATP-dependent helicase HrpA